MSFSPYEQDHASTLAQLTPQREGSVHPIRGSWVQVLPGAPEFKRFSTLQADAWPVCATFARPFIHRLGSSIVPFYHASAICNAQNRHSSDAIEHSIREAYEALDIGTGVVLGHRSRGMAEQSRARECKVVRRPGAAPR
jgi:hypothetical protein